MSLLASRQQDQFHDLQTTVIATLTETIRNEISTLPIWPQSIECIQRQIRDEAIAATSSRYEQPERTILRKDTALRNSDRDANRDDFTNEYASRYATTLAEVERLQWGSLWFPVIDEREEQITDAELETFNWILKPPKREDHTWDNFLEWLEHGKSVYWISGKAGSGKSTLMKYLSKRDEVKKTLASWADGAPLITAKFFFFDNGSNLQKTQEGLFRSLLYQSLENHRELIPIVLSDVTDKPLRDFLHEWRLSDLKSALQKLMEQRQVPVKICFFVDGLDEYAGDHSEIAAIFRSAAEFEHVKVCVSSRPLLVFDQAFKDLPGLMLQHLTFDDIRTYVNHKFSNDDRYNELKIEEPGFGPRLVHRVVTKASGVFLWVKLVVHSLLEGMQNFDRGADLERRLEELPEDLTKLYWHMLSCVRPTWYLKEGFKLLLLAHAAIQPLTLLQFAFSESDASVTGDDVADLSVERQDIICKRMRGCIKSRCLGLLEVTGRKGMDEKYCQVKFLHKSVRDFIDSRGMMRKIQDTFTEEEKPIPEMIIIRALSTELRTIKSRLGKGSIRTEGQITRAAWFDEIRPIVFEAIAYTIILDSKKCELRKVYAPLIKGMDESTTLMWNQVQHRSIPESEGLLHWSEAARKPGADSCWETFQIRQKQSRTTSNILFKKITERLNDQLTGSTIPLFRKRRRVSDTTIPFKIHSSRDSLLPPLPPDFQRRVAFLSGQDDSKEQLRTRLRASQLKFGCPTHLRSLFQLPGLSIEKRSEYRNLMREIGIRKYSKAAMKKRAKSPPSRDSRRPAFSQKILPFI